MSKREKRDPAYLREQGKREAQGLKQRKITFSLSKHIPNQGQTIEDWDQSGLLSSLYNRLKFVGQFTPVEVRQQKHIKEYTKVDFPPNSKFKKPAHIIDVTWAVMHITPNSKEVVVGYIEEDVFYLIFLDKNHEFWPSTLKNT
ncbi:MAG: hypothetical protein HYR91_08215 [Flavobacteriia bacterium]|nr:hypothetical protein [Flavobacteriia bacterium]